MALMIPETPAPTTNDTERHVFDALRRYLPDDCVVWHELPLARRDRSVLPDFIVIGPHIGLAVLEVKGWQIAEISKADKHRFTLSRRTFEEEKPNPLYQARNDVFTAIDIIQKSRDPLLVHQDGKLAGKLRFPFAPIVVLPNIRRREFDKKKLDQILQPHEVLVRDDLQEGLEQQLREMRLFPGDMNAEMIDAVRRILHPEVTIPVAQALEGQLPLLDLTQEQVVKSHLQLPSEGQALVRDLDARLVRGVVGSGKTLVLLYRAVFLSQINPNWRILILTYNRTLAEYLRCRLLDIGGNPEQIEITHFHKWCVDALSPSGWIGTILDENSQLGLVNRVLAQIPSARSLGDRFLVDEINWMKDHRLLTWNAYRQAVRHGRGVGLDEGRRRLVFSVFEGYQQQMVQARQLDWGDVPIRTLEAIDAGVLAPAQYHAVLIDEAQDFAPVWFQVVLRLLKSETNVLFLVADGAQKIYRRAFSWASVGISIRGNRSRVLSRSYRNTFEILTTAYEVIRNDAGTREDLEAAGEEVIEPEMTEGIMPHGSLPLLLQFSDPASEFAYLVSEIQKLIANGYRPGDILLAARHRETVADVARSLRTNGIPVQVLSGQTPNLEESTVKVSTLHSTKGLEFAVVFLCGLESRPAQAVKPESEVVESEERRLLYVGMTRAREMLYISYHGQVPGWVLETLQKHS